MSRINRMNTRLTDLRIASLTVTIRLLSSRSKLAKEMTPPPVKKRSPGLAEYFRSRRRASRQSSLFAVER
jgi:hypothetical protein